jgi:short-subunit dehydrogenase
MSYWQGKVVVVTGASGGLGLVLATTFAQQGARVVLAARGQSALDAATERLAQQGHTVLGIAADVTSQQQVDHLFQRTIAEFGQLDALVNNAGRSDRASVLDTTPEALRQLFDLNVLGVVRCTRAAAPHLLKQRGHLVNIGSLAGKSASRYVGGYPITKFAVSAYSQQLRLELGPEGLHVLLVCPGPIAREVPREYETPQLKGLPESASRPGAGVKTKAISPEHLSTAILRACERRRAELIIPAKARLLFAIQQLSPTLGDWLVKRMT